MLWLAAIATGIANAAIDLGFTAVLSEHASIASRPAASAGLNAITGARGIAAAFLMSALLERMGAVVSREQLAKSGWPRGAPGRNALDVHMLRLRRRIAPVGLAIKTVRSRGYLLEADATAALASS